MRNQNGYIETGSTLLIIAAIALASLWGMLPWWGRVVGIVIVLLLLWHWMTEERWPNLSLPKDEEKNGEDEGKGGD